ncbi:MAG: hypothetical protein ABI705_11635 [Aestuariivirga sp.]
MEFLWIEEAADLPMVCRRWSVVLIALARSRAELVQEDDISPVQGRDKLGFDIGFEDGRVRR